MSEVGGSKGVETEQHQQLVSERMELKSKSIGAIAMAGKPISAKIALKFLVLLGFLWIHVQFSAEEQNRYPEVLKFPEPACC